MIKKQEPLISSLIDEEASVLKLILMFVDQLPSIVNDINSFYKKSDWESFSLKIHSLKGIGGNFGFYEVTEVAEKIEGLLEKENYSEINSLLDELQGLQVRIVAGSKNYKP